MLQLEWDFGDCICIYFRHRKYLQVRICTRPAVFWFIWIGIWLRIPVKLSGDSRGKGDGYICLIFFFPWIYQEPSVFQVILVILSGFDRILILLCLSRIWRWQDVSAFPGHWSEGSTPKASEWQGVFSGEQWSSSLLCHLNMLSNLILSLYSLFIYF